MLNTNKGFSLLEVLTSLAVGSLLLLGILELSSALTKSQKTANSTIELDSLYKLINHTLASSNRCTPVFKDLKNNDVVLRFPYIKNGLFGKIKVSAKLQFTPPIGGFSNASLFITTTEDKIIGASQKNKTFSFKVEVNTDNKITQCSLSQAAEIDEEQFICSELGGEFTAQRECRLTPINFTNACEETDIHTGFDSHGESICLPIYRFFEPSPSLNFNDSSNCPVDLSIEGFKFGVGKNGKITFLPVCGKNTDTSDCKENSVRIEDLKKQNCGEFHVSGCSQAYLGYLPSKAELIDNLPGTDNAWSVNNCKCEISVPADVFAECTKVPQISDFQQKCVDDGIVQITGRVGEAKIKTYQYTCPESEIGKTYTETSDSVEARDCTINDITGGYSTCFIKKQ